MLTTAAVEFVPANVTLTARPRAEQIERMTYALAERDACNTDDNDGERTECARDQLESAFMHTTIEVIITRAVAALERAGLGVEGRALAAARAKRIAEIRTNISKYGRKAA